MRDIRGRIRSVRQSLQVTTAMKLISTSKLRKSRLRLEETKPYFEGIRRVLREIVEGAELEGGPWFDTRRDKAERHVATLVVTADRGLAGGFNNAVIRYVESACPPGSILLPIGSVGKRYFISKDYVLLEDFPATAKEPTTFAARDIANLAAELFLSGRVDEFHVVYTRLISAVKQEVETIKLLPLDAGRIKSPGKGEELVERLTRRAGPRVTYEAEPSEEALLAYLVSKYLKGVIYGALVESFASEQAARMAAMDAASKNARDMMERLQLLYNRARQAAITAEVSEIVAGAAALG